MDAETRGPRAKVSIAKEEPVTTEKPRLNRLAKEKSTYLRQHETNPVDWYPWGEEAFLKAKREDKPIFLSIGYSSCHWCHVMAHESFEDQEVADILNEHFVSIKVDREERPDVDEVYMKAATAIMRGGGGWPLSVWLTPDGKPFHAGTYFPKHTDPRFGRIGFVELLDKIVEAWKDPQIRPQLEKSGDQVQDFIGREYTRTEPAPLGAAVLGSIRAMAELGYDAQLGGFGQPPAFAPKFPSPSTVEAVLRAAIRDDDEKALAIVTETLDRMANGGIHDHIGGGFHRYSVTRDWLVPHFEKMLYDNGQLLGLYAWAYLVTGKELYADTARDIARWVQREMTNEHGGFFAAQDADDPGGPEGEGGFYTWAPAELKELFDDEETKVLEEWFDISKNGNWFVNGQQEKPGRSLLQRRRTREEIVEKSSMEETAFRALVERATATMYLAREKRPKPMTDKKVLTAWNGLMISGFVTAYQALGEESHLESALRAANFLKTTMIRDGHVLRRWAEGEAAHAGVLDDYAYLIAAFLDLYETTFDVAWLTEALALSKTTVALFHDPEKGGFYYTASDSKKLIARGKTGVDNARPSGNGVMAMNLLRLYDLNGDKTLRDIALKTLDCFGAQAASSVHGYASILNALDFAQEKTREIFIAGDPEIARPLIEAVWRDPRRNRVVALVTPEIEKLLPPARGKTPVDGKPAAYVCHGFECDLPTTDPAELAR